MIAVVGAGLAGVASALALQQAGADVVVIGADAPARPAVGESLPAASMRILRDLGVADVLDDVPHLRCAGHASAWSGPEVETRSALLDPEGPGWLIDRTAFDAALRRKMEERGICWHRASVRAVRREPDGVALVTGGGVLDADEVIDATGRAATLARSLGARRHFGDRVVARVRWGQLATDDARTLVEAVEEGWWYTARLPDDRIVCALHTDPAHAGAVRSDGAWEDALLRSVHVRAAVEGARWTDGLTADASPSWLDTAAGDRWLAVGDAAQAFDPIGSQGMFHALYTGLRGAEALLNGTTEEYLERLRTIRETHAGQRAWVLSQARTRARGR